MYASVKWLKGKESEDMSAELKMLEKMEEDVQEIEKSIKERKEVLQEIDQTGKSDPELNEAIWLFKILFTVNLNHRVEVELCVMFLDLEYRIDYQLREASFSNSYISMLTSHTSYWTDRDVAFFVLSHIHPELQDLWQPRSAEFHLKTLYYNFITQVYKSSCLYLSLFFKPTIFVPKDFFFTYIVLLSARWLL